MLSGGDENEVRRSEAEKGNAQHWGNAPNEVSQSPLGTILRRNVVQAKDALHSSKSGGRAAHIAEGYGWHAQSMVLRSRGVF